jgi:RNA polymerase sigma factor (sigma-70 family)
MHPMETTPHTADACGVGLSAIAFEEIYGQHMPELTRYCRGILRNRADAEDAAQNAMERALKALTEGPAPKRMRPWLFTIAQRESVNLLRRRSRQGLAELDESAPAPGGSPEELARVRERLAELLSDLQSLAPRQREVLVARELDGRSYADIAVDLGVTEAAAQQLVLEARQSLRQCEAGRSLACAEVQTWISSHDHAVIRTRKVRAHLRGCDACRGFQHAIASRRRDFGLLLPGMGGSALWSAISAGLGQGGAKLATAGAVAAVGVTVTVPVLGGGAAPPDLPALRADHPAALTATPAPALPVLAARMEQGATAAVSAQGAPRDTRAAARRAHTPRRTRVVLAERRATGITPAPTAAPVLSGDGDQASASRPARPTRTPAPASTPASTPAPGGARSGPVSEPLREALQPVAETVDAVRTAVPEVTDSVRETVQQVEDALPKAPRLGGD